MSTEEELIADIRACGRQLTNALLQYDLGNLSPFGCNIVLTTIHTRRWKAGQELLALRSTDQLPGPTDHLDAPRS